MNSFLFALDAWGETTTLHVTFKNVSSNSPPDEVINLTGELRISMIELLKSLMSLEGNEKRKFACLLSQSLLRTYIFRIPRGSHNDCNLPDSYDNHYPNSSVHEIKTGIQNLLQLVKRFHLIIFITILTKLVVKRY